MKDGIMEEKILERMRLLEDRVNEIDMYVKCIATILRSAVNEEGEKLICLKCLNEKTCEKL